MMPTPTRAALAADLVEQVAGPLLDLGLGAVRLVDHEGERLVDHEQDRLESEVLPGGELAGVAGPVKVGLGEP